MEATTMIVGHGTGEYDTPFVAVPFRFSDGNGIGNGSRLEYIRRSRMGPSLCDSFYEHAQEKDAITTTPLVTHDYLLWKLLR